MAFNALGAAMHTTIEFLEALKIARGGISDYQIAKLLDTPPQTVGAWRTGKATIGNELAVRVAELLEIEPDYVLACVIAEREHGARSKPVLDRMARKVQAPKAAKMARQIAGALRKGAAAAIAGISLFAGGIGAAPPAHGEAAGPGLYILSNRRRGVQPA